MRWAPWGISDFCTIRSWRGADTSSFFLTIPSCNTEGVTA